MEPLHAAPLAMHFEPEKRPGPRIRLFRSRILESLTLVHPAVVLAVWVPVIVWFLWQAWRGSPATGMTPGRIVAAFAVGLFAWTLVEYGLHRFVFHFSPEHPPAWVRRLVFLFHGIHHVQPWDPARLVMPPSAGIPLATLFYLLFGWILARVLGAPHWHAPLFAGFLCGYVAYDMLHYATHHRRMSLPVLRWLKRNHLLHHHGPPDERFGVSSPLWDHVFRTHPKRAPKREHEARLG